MRSRTIIDGIPLADQARERHDRPARLHVQPDELQPAGDHREPGAAAKASSSALSVPFQVTNCAVLAFKPKLTASTSGKTSRANGASLTVKLGYPAGPYDANIARVKVELPKTAPLAADDAAEGVHRRATFEANPANCPAASIIGHATATTPVLPVPLTGPAYFVSHGGEAFPSLIIVLQGYGATVHLRRLDVHQQSGDHEQHVQDGPRRPRRHLRTDAARRARTRRSRRTGTSARASWRCRPNSSGRTAPKSTPPPRSPPPAAPRQQGQEEED